MKTVYAVYDADNGGEPIYIFNTREAAEEYAQRRGLPVSSVSNEPVLNMKFVREYTTNENTTNSIA